LCIAHAKKPNASKNTVLVLLSIKSVTNAAFAKIATTIQMKRKPLKKVWMRKSKSLIASKIYRLRISIIRK
jgi:hypothetical protein